MIVAEKGWATGKGRFSSPIPFETSPAFENFKSFAVLIIVELWLDSLILLEKFGKSSKTFRILLL